MMCSRFSRAIINDVQLLFSDGNKISQHSFCLVNQSSLMSMSVLASEKGNQFTWFISLEGLLLFLLWHKKFAFPTDCSGIPSRADSSCCQLEFLLSLVATFIYLRKKKQIQNKLLNSIVHLNCNKRSRMANRKLWEELHPNSILSLLALVMQQSILVIL